MRRLLVAALVVAGCADDTLSGMRADSGVRPGDGGVNAPLALVPGMVFTYRAILTRRGEAQADEQNSQYTVKLTIDAADDRGTAGESTLTVSATEPSTIADDWMAPYDFDSWVGRLGPSLRDDRVGSTPVTAHLSKVPEIPPPPTPKVLPVADTFFIDVRKIDDIRAAFSSMYADRQPQVADPDAGAGKWRFAFSGPDAGVTYYRVKTREVTIAYDPAGYLTRLDETIGDIGMRPSASCRIELISGP